MSSCCWGGSARMACTLALPVPMPPARGGPGRGRAHPGRVSGRHKGRTISCCLCSGHANSGTAGRKQATSGPETQRPGRSRAGIRDAAARHPPVICISTGAIWRIDTSGARAGPAPLAAPRCAAPPAAAASAASLAQRSAAWEQASSASRMSPLPLAIWAEGQQTEGACSGVGSRQMAPGAAHAEAARQLTCTLAEPRRSRAEQPGLARQPSPTQVLSPSRPA